MNTLESWINAACAELGLDPAIIDLRQVLDLAREAAHQVDRPAAPVTAFLLGVAVAGGQPIGATAERLQALARGWSPQPTAG
ncbi:MAG TPA: DUF6457 domain-containing protein [Streptosporangiaceae bacterium]|jgi:hypothetical protein